MTIGALLVLVAQAANPAAHVAPAGEVLVTTATASVRILRPERFSSDTLVATVAAHPAAAQLRTDEHGIRWVDFS